MNDIDLHHKIGMLEDKLVGKNAKIHELDLFTIEQSKEIQELKEVIGNLKATIEEYEA